MPRYYDHVEQWDPGDVLPPGGGGMIPDAPAPPQIPIDEWTPPGYFPGLMPDYGFEDSTTVSAPDQPSVGSAPGSGGGTVPTLPGGGGGGGFNLGDLFGKLKKINPQQAAAIAMLAQQLFGGGRQSLSQQLKEVPQLQELLNLQTQQSRRQEPLHQAVTQLATNLLPNSAFRQGPGRPLIG